MSRCQNLALDMNTLQEFTKLVTGAVGNTEWLYHPDSRCHKNLLTADEAKREILEYCNYYNEERIQAKLNAQSIKKTVSQSGDSSPARGFVHSDAP